MIRLPILGLACHQHGQSDVAIARVNAIDQPTGMTSWLTEPSGESFDKSTIYRMSAKPSALLLILPMCYLALWKAPGSSWKTLSYASLAYSFSSVSRGY